MVEAIVRRRALSVPLAAGAVAAVGAATAVEPLVPLGLAAFAVFVLLSFAAPLAALLLLILMTAVVPYALQNRFGFGGGHGAPGLLPSDLLLVLGLARAALVVPTMRLDRRRVLIGLALVLFILVAFLQLVRGVDLGRSPSDVGAEFRRLLGFGAFFLALPLLAHLRHRQQLLKGLLVIGFVTGVWGMVQWVLQIGYSDLTGDVGVRPGVRLTSGGKGQVQGGLYAFPVAIVLAFSVILAGQLRSLAARALAWATLAANAVSCLLTFERTFWVATVLGIGFVVLKAPGVQRFKFLLAAPIVVLLAFAALATFAPAELATARERLLSLGQYRSDNSLRFRIVESRHVVEQIRERPLQGSGLAATIHFGRPYEQVLPETDTFSHNGYLWLAWKVGIPAAALLFVVLLAAVFARGRPGSTRLDEAVRDGAQGALLALLLVSVTFPTVNALTITATMGVLLALATLPPDEPRRVPSS